MVLAFEIASSNYCDLVSISKFILGISELFIIDSRLSDTALLDSLDISILVYYLVIMQLYSNYLYSTSSISSSFDKRLSTFIF